MNTNLWFGLITIFPDMFKSITDFGVTGKAFNQKKIDLKTWNPRNFTDNKHKTVDDRPYGGGPGMLMKPEPLRQAIQSAKQYSGCDYVAYLSPQGKKLDHSSIIELVSKEKIILLCGRYEGIDERIIDLEISEQWSIGDYVISGGEIAAMVMIDALSRFIPGVLGNRESVIQDSFYNGLLDYPQYTRPKNIEGKMVPDILLSGNHVEIERWRHKQSLGKTWLKRPDIIKSLSLNEQDKKLLQEFQQENYLK